MQAVMSLAEHVFVLAEGRIIAAGHARRRSPPIPLWSRPISATARRRSWRPPMATERAAHGARSARRLRRDRDPARRRSQSSTPARSSPCSAPTASANRRSIARSPASCGRAPVRSVSTARAIERAKPAEIVARGLIHVPEGRRIFPNLSVRENLDLGSYRRARRAARGQSRARLCDVSAAVRARNRNAPARCRAASSRCSPSAAA